MAVLAHSHAPVAKSELPWALRQGAIAGIIAGIVFAVYEMVVSAAMAGAGAFFMPLRMIGAIALGPAALEASYPLLAAGLAGVIVHMLLSVIYGAVFAVVAGGLRKMGVLVALAMAFGFALWVVNFYLIAPMAFPWFTETNPLVQFIGHTFFFGGVLGYALWSAHERLLRREGL